jgi:hypothetical protein
MADVSAGTVGGLLDGRRALGRAPEGMCWAVASREGQGSGAVEHGVLATAQLVMDGGVLEHGAARVGGGVLGHDTGRVGGAVRVPGVVEGRRRRSMF